MAAGVYRDKIFKREEPKHQLNTQPQTVIVNFIEAQRPPDREDPDTVEGELVRDDERQR